MIIKYFWESMVVNVPCRYSNHTRQVVEDVKHTYWVNISTQDIVQFLLSNEHLEPREKGFANYYMSKAVAFLVGNLSLDIDELEKDESFYDFMKERYEKDALEDWEKDNEAY